MYNHLLYFSYWLVNALVIYLFNNFFGSDVVLGNWKFGVVEASLYASFWVTFVIWCFWDFAIAKGLQFDSPVVVFGYFWVVNLFAFWLVSRFSSYFGFGVTSYFWPAVIALVAHALQRWVRRFFVSASV